MFEDDLVTLVKEHYARPKARILMLSNLGERLSEKSLQPPADDRRTLREIIEQHPQLTVVRDPDAAAYIAVVLKGEEAVAEVAIVERKQQQFIKRMPRALLLAFTLEIADGQHMAVHLGPPLVYQGGPEVADGWVAIDPELRCPGLDVRDPRALTPEDATALERGIRSWCERNDIDPVTLVRPKPVSKAHTPSHAPYGTSTPSGTNALERLYEAQSPDIADRLFVPIDIALRLSRMP